MLSCTAQRHQRRVAGLKRYIFQNAVALDQLANTMIPGGMADETLSARAYRMRRKNSVTGAGWRISMPCFSGACLASLRARVLNPGGAPSGSDVYAGNILEGARWVARPSMCRTAPSSTRAPSLPVVVIKI